MEIAVTVARYMGVRVSVIRRVLKSFAGLPGREEILGTFRGITIVNDTTATTPDGTIVALSRFVIPAQIGIRPRSKAVDSLRQPADHGNDKRTIHLIFGGADKELEFESSARTIKSHTSTVWLLPGTAHEKIVSAWKQARVSWTDVLDLREALTRIKSLARKGDVVLLSPGCASFGLFENEFHRGEVFAKLVKKLFR
jgi:UDP-N-acetylmuramoylalanine--D-glutamate ligase